MSRRILPMVGASVVAVAVAVAVAVSFASTASASGSHVTMFHHSKAQHAVPLKNGGCYGNLQNDSGVGIVSQNFESSFDIYDAYGTDGFSTTKTCKATGVYVVGRYFNGSGPAASETVTFYKENGGVPGTVIDSQTVTGADNAGSFTIPLNTVALPPGPKFVSVVANLNFSSGGQWGWELSNNQKQGSNGLWENPGDGFGRGCTTWGDVLTCVGYGNDFMIAVTKG